MPTHSAAYELPRFAQLTEGTIHEPLTSLTEPAAPVTANPPQFVEHELVGQNSSDAIFIGRAIVAWDGALLAPIGNATGVSAAASMTRMNDDASAGDLDLETDGEITFCEAPRYSNGI